MNRKKIITCSKPFTEDEEEFKRIMLGLLPPIIPRAKVEELTLGWIKKNTLKQDEANGLGPTECYKTRSGRRIFYSAEKIVDYGIRRFGISKRELPSQAKVLNPKKDRKQQDD